VTLIRRVPAVLRAGLQAGALAFGGLGAPGLAAQGRVAPADTAGLMATVRVLAADSMEGRRIGTPGGARARAYLLRRLAALGLPPLGAGYQKPFTVSDSVVGVNLLAVIRGSRDPGRYIVLSAHYDHVGIIRGEIYNGADDNASGTAAVLAIAEALQQRPLEHSVVIALLDGEESGLRGARAFLAAKPVPVEAIALDVNLDMVSHSDSGELWATGTAFTPSLLPPLDSLAKVAPVRLRFGHDRAGVAGQEDWTNESDQGPFHAAGIPFIYFGVEDHKDYHKPTDDPGTITPVFFGGAVGTMLEALRRLDRVLR
jgi:hypothetical protein